MTAIQPPDVQCSCRLLVSKALSLYPVRDFANRCSLDDRDPMGLVEIGGITGR